MVYVSDKRKRMNSSRPCDPICKPSGDFEDEQGVRNIDSLHPGQDMELFRMFFWNRKSRAFSKEATGPFISSSREKSTMSGIRIVVVFVDDGN